LGGGAVLGGIVGFVGNYALKLLAGQAQKKTSEENLSNAIGLAMVVAPLGACLFLCCCWSSIKRN